MWPGSVGEENQAQEYLNDFRLYSRPDLKRRATVQQSAKKK